MTPDGGSDPGKEGREPRPAPTEAQVRSALLRFAQVIQRLEEEGRLLRSLPFLMGRLGDLRRLVFEFEVRVTERLLPIEDPNERESRRVVREAREAERDAAEEWKSESDDEDWTGGSEDEEPDEGPAN